MPPKRFGPYELVRPLATGGMAETFVAVRHGPADFEQRVCLKRILPERAGEPAFVEQFLDEARLLAQLRCPGIVQVYDFGAVEGAYYMALELVEGADLERLCSASPVGDRISSELALFIATQLLVALDYAHNASVQDQPLNIVHRDISPSNILLSSHGDVKLTDFGIAKSSHSRHKTKTGRTKGKLAYMSPEQVRGEALDGRSDLFALGVVLYELLAGTHPFEANTDLALLHNIITGTRRPLAAVVPELSTDVTTFVECLLATDAKDRHPSAEAALAALPTHGSQVVAKRVLASKVSRYLATRPVKKPFQSQVPRRLRSEIEAYDQTRDLPVTPEARVRSTLPLANGRSEPSGTLALESSEATRDLITPSATPERSSSSRSRTRAAVPPQTRRWNQRFSFSLALVGLLCVGAIWFSLASKPSAQPAQESAAPTMRGARQRLSQGAPSPVAPRLSALPTRDAGQGSESDSAHAPLAAPSPALAAPPTTPEAESGAPQAQATAGQRTKRKRAREPSTPRPATTDLTQPAPSPESPRLAPSAPSRSGLGVSAEDF
ncbi:MAG: protein kinase [Myxococcales bacterium]